MKLVHMDECLKWFPALPLESSNPDKSNAVAAVSKDRLSDELLIVVLSDSQRIDADRIVDERAKVMDMRGDPLA